MSFLGTCVNSFDEDGYCDIPGLPYSDTTEFAQAEEEAKKISSQEFLKAVGEVPKDLKAELSDNLIFLHDIENDLYMIYDDNTDVHYFFNSGINEDYKRELAEWKRIAGITEATEQTTIEQPKYKIGTAEWFNRPINTNSFPTGFRGRVKKR
jgi:hypothetical protein